MSQEEPDLYKKVDQKKMMQWVDSVFDKMNSDQRIGQLFMIIADPGTSTRITQKIVNNIKEQHVGGILFSKGDAVDQATSTNLYQKTSKIPLLVSFDGEWGLSMRLEGTPRFPKNVLLGAISNNDLLYYYGEEMGQECKKMGVHINFAPVLDVNCNPDNPVIGSRSFGENALQVSAKGIAYAKGLESTGVMAVAKHFPGHGDTSDDSHKTLPLVTHNRQRLDEVDLYPFVQYIKSGFSGVMTGHLSVPALDKTSGKPSSLSPVIIKDLLQGEFGFKGLTFTDALVMKGADSGTESVCVQALLAGNDVLLSPANPAKEFEAVKKAVQDGVLKMEDIEKKCLKILCYKYIVGLNNYKPVNTTGLQSRLNSTYSEWLIQRLNEEGITLLKNTDDVVPVKGLEKKRIAVLSLGSDNYTDFQQTLGLYAKMDFFALPLKAKEKQVSDVFKKLESYDLIICGIHSHRIESYTQLRQLAAKKELHLSFFTSPYLIQKFGSMINSAKSVIMAYEDTEYSEIAAAQIIMGGVPAKGRLPITIAGLFDYGDGLKTEKVRLAYQFPEEVKMSSNKLAEIDKIVKDGLQQKAFPGCQVLVAKDGVVVYNKSFGYFDFAKTHPVRNSDVYDLASVTKAAATVPAVMKLFDEKKFGLQDKLSKFIPELKDTDKDDITVKDALYHESGLVAFLPFYQMAIDKNSYTGPLYSGKRDLTYRTEYDINTYTRTDFKFDSTLVSEKLRKGFDLQVARNFYLKSSFQDMVLKRIANSTLKKKGSYLYSDLNFMLLKEVVENVSQRSFDNYLESNFYARLGADQTMFKPLQRIDTLNIAPTENDQFLRNQVLIGFPDDEAAAFMGGVSGNAGLFSNANDLAKLLQMLLNDGTYGDEKYISKETCQLFTTTKSPVSRRGLGFDKPDMNKKTSSPTGDKAPAGTYGHTGFTGTCFWVDPDNQLIFIFLSNRVYPSRTNRDLMKLNIRSRIQDAIYEAIK